MHTMIHVVSAQEVSACLYENQMEGRKEILLMRATTEVDWHVNVWSEQISGPQIYQGKQ